MAGWLKPYVAWGGEPQVLQILAPDGSVDGKLMDEGAKLQDGEVLKLYEVMVKARIMDRQAMTLQRQGRVKGTYAPSEGNEAADVASCYVMGKDDWIFPAYRQLGVLIMRGIPLVTLMAKLIGNSGDPNKGRQLPVEWGFRDYNIASVGAPIGPSIIHAVGVAWAMRYRGRDTMTLCYFGDGGTSTNDFHSGLNFAGVYGVPCIFFCVNNLYAISVPVNRQTAVKRLSTKAVAYGIEGISVDGMDIFAVYKATAYAAERARKEKLSTMIEATTYRYGPHTTADDPLTRYRPASEVEEWRKKDPLTRLKLYMTNTGLLSESDDKELWSRAEAEIRAAVREAEALPPVPVRELITDVYAFVDPMLEEEFEEIMEAMEVKQAARG